MAKSVIDIRKLYFRNLTFLYYVSKNDTDIAHYNFDADQPILIIFSVRFTFPSLSYAVYCHYV